MMNKNALKKELIQKIINCKDQKLLLQIAFLVKEIPNKVGEPAENYKAKSLKYSLSKEQLEEIARRNEEYNSGELKTESLETFNKKMFEKYGF